MTRPRVVVAVIALAVAGAVASIGLIVALRSCVEADDHSHGPDWRSSSTNLYPSGTGDDWEFRITWIETLYPFRCYQILPFIGAGSNPTIIGVIEMAPQAYLAGSPTSFHVNLTDSDNDGRLTEGDLFVLGNLEPGNTYGLIIRWKEDGGDMGIVRVTV